MMDKEKFKDLVYMRFDEKQKQRKKRQSAVIKYCSFAFAFVLISGVAFSSMFGPANMTDSDPETFYSSVFENVTESFDHRETYGDVESGTSDILYENKNTDGAFGGNTTPSYENIVKLSVFGDEMACVSVLPKNEREAELAYNEAAKDSVLTHAISDGGKTGATYIFSVRGSAEISFSDDECVINVTSGEDINLYIISFSKNMNIYFKGGNS